MTEILFERYYCKATSLRSALVHSHLTYILRSSTTTSNLVRIFSHTYFCQQTKTIKLTVIFTTSCFVNSILKHTGIHYKSCMQSAISISLSFYCTNRMNPTNHISWNGLAGLGGSYSPAPSPTSHRERCMAGAPLSSAVRPWPSSNTDHMSSRQIRSRRQPSENNCIPPGPTGSKGF